MRFKLTSLKMPPILIDRLDAESKRTGAPKAEIVRRAIDEYLRQREGNHGKKYKRPICVDESGLAG